MSCVTMLLNWPGSVWPSANAGVWDGEEVVVDLDVVQVAAALRAAR
jgi:hypothetical protein